jgi:hypothetical protein
MERIEKIMMVTNQASNTWSQYDTKANPRPPVKARI